MTHNTLTIEPAKRSGSLVEVGAILSVPGRRDVNLWYRVPERLGNVLVSQADPFVVAFVFPMMRQGRDVRVIGQVSPSLLRQIETFMHIWEAWYPEDYRKIEITATDESEAPVADTVGEAVMAFSGGVDSCYTAWRHRHGEAGRHTTQLTGGVFIHGFDIPLCMEDAFENARRRNADILASLDMDLFPLATNFRDLDLDVAWEDAHGALIASCLSLFAGRFRIGLIASSLTYARFGLRWGSSAWTDGLLSSPAMEIRNDGAETSRLNKIRTLTRWPEALEHMRVCWEGPQKDSNCCRCEKCVRTILAFRIAGVPRPPCFPTDVSDEQIRSLRLHSEIHETALQLLLEEAYKAALGRERWVHAAEQALARNARRTRRRRRRRAVRRRLSSLWRSLRG